MDSTGVASTVAPKSPLTPKTFDAAVVEPTHSSLTFAIDNQTPLGVASGDWPKLIAALTVPVPPSAYPENNLWNRDEIK